MLVTDGLSHPKIKNMSKKITDDLFIKNYLIKYITL